MSPRGEEVLERLLDAPRNRTDDLPALVEAALEDPGVLERVVRCTVLEEAAGAARAAWVVRRVAERRPEALRSHRAFLVGDATRSPHWEVRAELCHVLPRVGLTPKQAGAALAFLARCGTDPSRIVQAWALDALVRLAPGRPALEGRVEALLLRALESPHASVRARARRLVAERARAARRRPTRKA